MARREPARSRRAAGTPSSSRSTTTASTRSESAAPTPRGLSERPGVFAGSCSACRASAACPRSRRRTVRRHARDAGRVLASGRRIAAFGRLVSAIASRAARVVDVGSGHGHLTRNLAERVGLPVVGLERDGALAGAARRRSSEASPPPTFTITDVLQDGLTLSDGDCVVGLHACGELGDAMVTTVASSPGATLALVGCCLQKRRQLSRRPLCAIPGLEDANALLDLPRTLLGLSNLVPGDEGVEASRTDNLLGRERRLALHRLLSSERPLRFGGEIEGLNRRAAQRDLSVLVARAFAIRGHRPPPRAAIDDAAAWAREEHARSRRLSVPRALLARALEVYVLYDRAAYLEERGFEVAVGPLFPASVSPRNLALVAWPKGAGIALPAMGVLT